MIPEVIDRHIHGLPFTCDSVGKSGSQVRCYDHAVLKILPAAPGFWDEVRMLRWLEDRLPVPKVLEAAEEDGLQYLLMSRVPGKMACSAELLEEPEKLIEFLARALKTLWQVDITHCPRQLLVKDYLAQARKRVEQGLVDVQDAEPETFGPGGFADPRALLTWLEENQPVQELCLCHGDFCLPNVLFEEGKLTGFIDLGDCAVGDPWRDIALCYRSLRHNFSGKYASKVIPADPDLLFEKLGIPKNEEKLRYHTLLDELF